jgi:hypothetical protein
MNVESNGQRYLGKYNTPKSAIANRNRQSLIEIANPYPNQGISPHFTQI